MRVNKTPLHLLLPSKPFWTLLFASPSNGINTLQIAALVSLLAHALVIFGLGIRPPDFSKLDQPAPQLDVVLVNSRSDHNVKADTLAQYSLDGGGNVNEDKRASNPLPMSNSDQTSLSLKQQQLAQLQQQAQQLMTQLNSKTRVPDQQQTAKPVPMQATPTPDAQTIMDKSLEIARLEAQVEQEYSAYQKLPRRKFLGARTQEYRFARYIDDWRLKIERIGTVNYPQEARDQHIYGSLQMTVSIRSDGSVENIQVDRSSGQKVLDDAARRIVQLGAPYAPFPADIAQDTDILSITRTWTFTTTDQLQTK